MVTRTLLRLILHQETCYNKRAVSLYSITDDKKYFVDYFRDFHVGSDFGGVTSRLLRDDVNTTRRRTRYAA